MTFNDETNTIETNEEGELLTVSEVSKMLGVSKMSIYRMLHAGQLPHLKKDGGTYAVLAECARTRISRSSIGR